MYADDETNEEADQASSPSFLASRRGLVLPLAMLSNALGPQLRRFESAPTLCAVVRVTASEWVEPLKGAAKTLAVWNFVVEHNPTTRERDKAIGEVVKRLAIGDRVLCVAPAGNEMLNRMLLLADLVVEVDGITKRDLSDAIRITTGSRPRGLSSADLLGLDLANGMAAIRQGTSAASCVRRIRQSRWIPSVDPLVAAAPALKNLHGYGEAKKWGERLVADLNRWRAGALDLSEIQRNAVLAGPPGVGKSTFVRSLAKSTELPLVVSSMGSLFASTTGYLDSVIKGIDAVFECARRSGPAAILLFDELEGFPSRNELNTRNDHNVSWWTPVINHMLTSLDSALSKEAGRLIVIGATNFPDRLDPALIRKGRLDQVFWISHPDDKDLAAIYRQHLGGDLPDADLGALSALALGCTGADAVGHIKGARARSRAEDRPVRLQDLMEEISPRSSMADEDVWRVCVHECGHAVAAVRLGLDDVKAIAITGSKGEGGRIVYANMKQRIPDADSHRSLIIRLLAGRAAEEVLLGSISPGAGGGPDSDLARASQLVAAGHLSWGLGKSLLYLGEPESALATASVTPFALRLVQEDLEVAYGAALDLMHENARTVLALAERLQKERVMSGERILQIIGDVAQARRGLDA